MPYKEHEIEKIYFTVGESAMILGINASCVRFWLIHFGIDKRVRREKTAGRHPYRKLTASDLNKLFEIKRLLKEEGLHIWMAKKRLANFTPESVEIANVMNPIP